jgi:uncharacterized protein YbaP (TraB family)
MRIRILFIYILNYLGLVMKKIKIIVLLSLFIISASYSLSSAQDNFLWRVQSKQNTVFILGSIHLLKKDAYPLNKVIEDSFEKSDFLAVEANVNDISQLDPLTLASKAFYPAGDGLDKHVSKRTMETIRNETNRIGLPIEIVMNQKPWFLAMILESFELLKAGFEPEYGIDQHFLSQADGKKKIFELESLDYQIQLLSGFNDSEQDLFLLYTLNNLKTIVQDADEIFRVWKSGNTQRMVSVIAKSSIEDKGFNSLYEKLVTNRNKNMALKIEDYLKTKKTYFVVIGAEHLVGEK